MSKFPENKATEATEKIMNPLSSYGDDRLPNMRGAQYNRMYEHVHAILTKELEQKARYDLHIKNCECGDDSTGSLNINSCNICGYHVVGNPTKTRIVEHITTDNSKVNINLLEENGDLKQAIQSIYSQCGDGTLDKKWVGWESEPLKTIVKNSN